MSQRSNNSRLQGGKPPTDRELRSSKTPVADANTSRTKSSVASGQSGAKNKDASGVSEAKPRTRAKTDAAAEKQSCAQSSGDAAEEVRISVRDNTPDVGQSTSHAPDARTAEEFLPTLYVPDDKFLTTVETPPMDHCIRPERFEISLNESAEEYIRHRDFHRMKMMKADLLGWRMPIPIMFCPLVIYKTELKT